MSEKKKSIRSAFRTIVLDRDRHRCKVCKIIPVNGDDGLDVHHITNRKEMPNGGYVNGNGIALCSCCHKKAEEFHCTGEAAEGYSPEDLYKLIGSSYKKAIIMSRRSLDS